MNSCGDILMSRGAVAPGAFELQHDVAGAIALEPFVGDRGTRDVAAQAFESLSLMRVTAHPGMQAEVVRIGAGNGGGAGRVAATIEIRDLSA